MVSPGGRPVLSRRQQQVVELVVEGLTNRQIAKRLSISPKTAEGHLEQVRNKLGVSSRLQIAAWAMRQPSRVEPVPAFPPATGTLPSEATSFIGREAEVGELTRLLKRSQLLTLTGEGGVGKSRLAVELARALATAYPQGVWWVDLGPLVKQEVLPEAVASVLGIRERPRHDLPTTLVQTLRERHTLLVLDNCEHLLEAVSELADRLLDHSARLTILATSRERLNLRGELVWRVEPLSHPGPSGVPDTDEVTRFAAVRLFVDRCQMMDHTFKLTPANASAVSRICQHLDGLPLALELAAAHVDSIPIDEMLTRLDGRFQTWATGHRGMPRRQQTLRATIDWSHRLLNSQERTLFRRVSVFSGSFSLEAAERVCSFEPLQIVDVMPALSRLVQKSLLRLNRSERGVFRYRQLETVRHFALQELLASADSTSAAERHSDYFAALARTLRDQEGSAEESAWLQVATLDHENLRGALSWTVAHQRAEALQLALGLSRTCELHGRLAEGRKALMDALRAVNQTTTLSLRVQEEIGWLAWRQGDYTGARDVLFAAMESAGRADMEVPAGVLNNLGMVELCEDNYAASQKYLQQSLALTGAPPLARSTAAHFLGVVSYFLGDLDASAEYFQRLHQLSEAQGNPTGMAYFLGYLGNLAVDRGELTEARTQLREAVRTITARGDNVNVLVGLEALVRLAVAEGRHEMAMRLGGAIASLHEITGAASIPAWERVVQRDVDRAQQALGPRAGAVWSAGRKMTLVQALDLALRDREPAS